jgi:hypothetical protein
MVKALADVALANSAQAESRIVRRDMNSSFNFLETALIRMGEPDERSSI